MHRAAGHRSRPVRRRYHHQRPRCCLCHRHQYQSIRSNLTERHLSNRPFHHRRRRYRHCYQSHHRLCPPTRMHRAATHPCDLGSSHRLHPDRTSEEHRFVRTGCGPNKRRRYRLRRTCENPLPLIESGYLKTGPLFVRNNYSPSKLRQSPIWHRCDRRPQPPARDYSMQAHQFARIRSIPNRQRPYRLAHTRADNQN